jgi:hypothetical protein
LQEIRVDSPAHFEGRLTNAGRGAIHLEGTLSAELTGWCARCLVPVTRPVVVAVSETFRTGMTTDGAESADGSYGYGVTRSTFCRPCGTTLSWLFRSVCCAGRIAWACALFAVRTGTRRPAAVPRPNRTTNEQPA